MRLSLSLRHMPLGPWQREKKEEPTLWQKHVNVWKRSFGGNEEGVLNRVVISKHVVRFQKALLRLHPGVPKLNTVRRCDGSWPQ